MINKMNADRKKKKINKMNIEKLNMINQIDVGFTYRRIKKNNNEQLSVGIN